MIVNIRMVQEHLGGNTTHVQASAAKIRILFDYDSLESKLTGANGGYVTPRAATDNRNIVLSHTALLPQASGPRATDASPGAQIIYGAAFSGTFISRLAVPSDVPLTPPYR